MTNFLPNIEHVVFLMLENRSFDNVLGWLYEDTAPVHIIDGPSTQGRPFIGLQGGSHTNRFDDDPTAHAVQRGTANLHTPDPDPHEPYLHVTKQLFGIDVPPCGERNQPQNPTPNTPATMDGFLADYATTRTSPIGPLAVIADECGLLGRIAKKLSSQISKEQALAILETYTPEQLPVLNGLARDFAVSDHWFSSVPTQTNTNRAFSVCGTSLGLTDNAGTLFGFVPDRFKTDTIWDRLTAAGKSSPDDWMVYYQQKLFGLKVYTQAAFNIPDPDTHVASIDRFFEQVETDTLPAFSYLEPIWLGAHIGNNGNSYHPPAQLEPGEAFVKKLVTKLSANKEQWDKTLLMVTFDEHGGTYDHEPPPWGATPPWGDEAPGFDCEHDFGFDRFGVRVPTILASPWIEKNTVFRSQTDVPYDHTSMIATILTWMGVDRSEWKLGERVANAPTFEGVLTRSSPRADRPFQTPVASTV